MRVRLTLLRRWSNSGRGLEALWELPEVRRSDIPELAALGSYESVPDPGRVAPCRPVRGTGLLQWVTLTTAVRMHLA